MKETVRESARIRMDGCTGRALRHGLERWSLGPRWSLRPVPNRGTRDRYFAQQLADQAACRIKDSARCSLSLLLACVPYTPLRRPGREFLRWETRLSGTPAGNLDRLRLDVHPGQLVAHGVINIRLPGELQQIRVGSVDAVVDPPG